MLSGWPTSEVNPFNEQIVLILLCMRNFWVNSNTLFSGIIVKFLGYLFSLHDVQLIFRSFRFFLHNHFHSINYCQILSNLCHLIGAQLTLKLDNSVNFNENGKKVYFVGHQI